MVTAGVCLGIRGALWYGVYCPSCVDLAENQPAVSVCQTAVLWGSSGALYTSLRMPCCRRCCWMCTVSQQKHGMSWQKQTWGMVVHSVVFCVWLLTGFQTNASSVPWVWSPGTAVQFGPLRHSLLGLKKKILIPDHKKQKKT